MSRWNSAFALASGVLLLGLTSTRARADLIITASDVTLAPGGIGTMDFSITSTTGTDTLSAFGMELMIAPVHSTSVLQFTTSQPTPYGNPNYVFANQSFNSDFGLPLWDVPVSPPNPFVTLNGGDSNDGLTPPGYVTIPTTAGAPYSYLGTVQFQAAPGATAGDQFQISLVSNPLLTYFDDLNSNPLTYSYATGGGLVTIGSVPEPTSLAMASIAGLGGLLGYWRSRRRRRSPGSSSVTLTR